MNLGTIKFRTYKKACRRAMRIGVRDYKRSLGAHDRCMWIQGAAQPETLSSRPKQPANLMPAPVFV